MKGAETGCRIWRTQGIYCIFGLETGKEKLSYHELCLLLIDLLVIKMRVGLSTLSVPD